MSVFTYFTTFHSFSLSFLLSLPSLHSYFSSTHSTFFCSFLALALVLSTLFFSLAGFEQIGSFVFFSEKKNLSKRVQRDCKQCCWFLCSRTQKTFRVYFSLPSSLLFGYFLPYFRHSSLRLSRTQTLLEHLLKISYQAVQFQRLLCEAGYNPHLRANRSMCNARNPLCVMICL